MSEFTSQVQTPLDGLMPYLPYLFAVVCLLCLDGAIRSGRTAWYRWQRHRGRDYLSDPVMRGLVAQMMLSRWYPLVECLLLSLATLFLGWMTYAIYSR